MDNKNAKSPFTKLVQIGIIVKDIDKTINRLSEFGLGPFAERKLPSNAKEWYGDKPLKATYRLAAVNVGGVDIELIQPVEGQSPHREYLDSRGEGIHHLAFASDDVDKTIKDFTDKGAQVQLKAEIPPKFKVAYMDMGTGGLVFEFMEEK